MRGPVRFLWLIWARLWLFEASTKRWGSDVWNGTEKDRSHGVENDLAFLPKISLQKYAKANEGSCWCAMGSQLVLNEFVTWICIIYYINRLYLKKVTNFWSRYRVISLRCRILLSFYSEMPYISDFILIVSERAYIDVFCIKISSKLVK